METTCRAMHELGVCAREEDGPLLNTGLTATLYVKQLAKALISLEYR